VVRLPPVTQIAPRSEDRAEPPSSAMTAVYPSTATP
jgi:hypothetical protein